MIYKSSLLILDSVRMIRTVSGWSKKLPDDPKSTRKLCNLSVWSEKYPDGPQNVQIMQSVLMICKISRSYIKWVLFTKQGRGEGVSHYDWQADSVGILDPSLVNLKNSKIIQIIKTKLALIPTTIWCRWFQLTFIEGRGWGAWQFRYFFVITDSNRFYININKSLYINMDGVMEMGK